MKYKELGNTGIKIPPVIFGTSALGNLYKALDDKIKLKIIRNCFEYMQPPVVFDTAGKYGAGLALEVLGKCLQKLNIRTEDVIISNKLAWIRTPLTAPEPTFEKGVWHNLENDAVQSISYEGIMRCWEQGNELLGDTYRPQLLSVHDPDEYIQSAIDEHDQEKRFRDILDAYKALSDLKSGGEIKAVGIGAKNWRIIERVCSEVALDWVMFANSITIMRHPPELLNFMEQLHKRGVGIINSAVFHAGFLTGGVYFDYRHIYPDTPENIAIFNWRKDFFSICNKYNILPSVACVAFGLSPPGVISISLNTSNPGRVKENVDSVISDVPDDFWKEMIKKRLIRRDYPYFSV
jgi:D-threo-aldose 1-dehydrogenase